MKEINIEINDVDYYVKVAVTNTERSVGFQKTSTIGLKEGMIFPFKEETKVEFWMKDTHIPLLLVFINDDWEVIRVAEGEPLSENMITQKDTKYVLELNVAAPIEAGDYVDLNELEEYLDEVNIEELEDDDDDEEKEMDGKLPEMIVLDAKGKEQMRIIGGERIFSRKNTKTLISMVKRAKRTKSDSDYKRIGTKIFKFIKIQDEKEDDYVDIPK